MSELDGRKVLIVEDSYFVAADAARALRRERMEVLKLCACVEDALDVLAQQQPDCVLLDIKLGDGTSFELADRLRDRDIPIVFYPGYECDAIPTRFATAPCLHKPARGQHLVEAIARLKLPTSS